MSNTKHEEITDRDAKAAVKSVMEQFAIYEGMGYGMPDIMRDFNREGDCVMVWDGPANWAYIARSGGCDYESQVEIPEAKGWPEGVWLEAVNGCQANLFYE